jgi:hypothetical protein
MHDKRNKKEKKKLYLVVGDGLAKGLALHGVFGRLVQAAAGQAHRAHCHGRTRAVKRSHCNLEALAHLSQHIL